MTVTTANYIPVLVPYSPGVNTYSFQLEIVGPQAFEVWFIDGLGVRTGPASPNEYNVQFFGKPPIFDAGEVELTRDAPVGTASLSIERNTPITQLLDFKNAVPFPMDMIEYTLDKHTMICQELAYRKCRAFVGTEMTQLIDFEPYTPLYSAEVDYGVQKIIDILAEIAGSAEDCSDTPELT